MVITFPGLGWRAAFMAITSFTVRLGASDPPYDLRQADHGVAVMRLQWCPDGDALRVHRIGDARSIVASPVIWYG
jgi:hypothetical protein